MLSDVDNFPEFHNRRYQLIHQIQNFKENGCSNREIARRLSISTKTVQKYITGNPELLSAYEFRQSKLDIFHDDIVKCLNNGCSKSKTVKLIYAHGYTGSKSNAFDYLTKVERECRKIFEPQPYMRTKTESLKYKTGSKGRNCDYITRNGVFNYLWMNVE